MTIDLNKKMVTKEALMSYLSDYEIYAMYMNFPNILGGNMNSPLRDDEKPSFGFFMGENNEICFKDFLIGAGDCIKFVMLKFGLNYFEALSKIAIDSNLDRHFIVKNTFKTNIATNSFNGDRETFIKKINSSTIGKTSTPWTLQHYGFWNQFGITKPTLEKYKVEPVSYIHIGSDKKIIKTDFHTYCFNEFKDGKNTFKIYQPYNIEYKWLNNHNDSVWQGWEQLPEKGDKLIITKSLKDVMSIHDVCGVPSVSLQAETVIPKQHIIDELKSRFKFIYILYDNDYDKDVNWGKEFSKKLSSQFQLINKSIETNLKSKDFSDLVKNHGEIFAKDYLDKLIELPF